MEDLERKHIKKSEEDYESISKVLSETPVCPYCLKPCSPYQYYCKNCGSDDVINPLASYMSFVNLRFSYSIFKIMWNKLWYDKKTHLVSRIFYLFLILSFTPILLLIGLPMLIIGKIPQPAIKKITVLCLAIALLLIGFYFLFSSFWPYLKFR